MQVITIQLLDRPIHSGDWHDKPLKWTVNGPNNEVQHFATKKDATLYKRLRRNAKDQSAAIELFVQA